MLRNIIRTSGGAATLSAMCTSRAHIGTAKASAKTSAATPSPSSSPSSPSPSSPSSAAAMGRRKPSAPAASAVHKFSSNTADASAYVVEGGSHDVPSYSLPAHMAFLAFHGRRMWLPAMLLAGYAALPAALLATPAAQGIYWTMAVLLQRLSVRGAANHAAKDLTGHTCVVTGGTSGIGLFTAQQLLNAGAHVVIASRPGREEATREFLLATCADSATEATAAAGRPPLAERITFLSLDFHDQLDVKAAAARLKAMFDNRIDLLVNCAGVWTEEPGVTKQGFEEHIGVNFLGPFHFTEALLPSLRRAKNRCGRVVYVTCAAHNGVKTTKIVAERMMLKPGPDAQQLTARCYSASKLGNIYHAQSIASRRYEGIPLNKPSDLHPVDVVIADPGFCMTNLTNYNRRDRQQSPEASRGLVGDALSSLWAKNALEGAQTVVNCCMRDEFVNGGYYHECRNVESGLSKRAQDAACREEVIRWAMAKTIAAHYSTHTAATATGAGAAAGKKDH